MHKDDIKLTKGVKFGHCNRSACLSPSNVIFFNVGTEKYYCLDCAVDLNEVNPMDAYRKMYPDNTHLCMTDDKLTPQDWYRTVSEKGKIKQSPTCSFGDCESPTYGGAGNQTWCGDHMPADVKEVMSNFHEQMEERRQVIEDSSRSEASKLLSRKQKRNKRKKQKQKTKGSK